MVAPAVSAALGVISTSSGAVSEGRGAGVDGPATGEFTVRGKESKHTWSMVK